MTMSNASRDSLERASRELQRALREPDQQNPAEQLHAIARVLFAVHGRAVIDAVQAVNEGAAK